MTKTGSRKIGILLAVLICLSAWLSVGAFASESPEAAYEVAEGEWVEGSLVEAAEKVMDGGEIKLLRNVELAVRNNEAWNMTGDREITLFGEGFSICLVGQAISVGDNVVLNLGAEGYTETLTIYSESDTNMIIGVDDGATLNMYDNVTLGPSEARGQPGCMNLSDRAVFNMYGGTITGCVNDGLTPGAILMTDSAKFNMSGGVIESCRGGNGAAIAAQPVNPPGDMSGGPATIKITDGIIRDCLSASGLFGFGGYGGAILAASDDDFCISVDISGGTISGCTGEQSGGAICISSGNRDDKISISDVVITGCEAYISGGGIYIDAAAAGVTIGAGAKIYDNKAPVGDDLHVYDGASVLLSDVPSGLTLSDCGHAIDGWYIDSAEKLWSCGGEVSRYSVSQTAVTGPLYLKAAHGDVTPCYITVTVTGKGSVDPAGSVVTVTKGQSRTFTFTPDSGYHIEDVLVDGVSVGTAGSYTFSNVQGDHELEVIFAETRYTLSYNSNGGTQYADESHPEGTVVELDKVPSRPGFSFTGWFEDEELTSAVESVTMDDHKTVHAGWEEVYVPPYVPPVTPSEPAEPEPAPNWLNTEDHFGYIIGYGDGTVRPEAPITRAEVATIFFRLLTDEARESFWCEESGYSDVAAGDWFNTAVSTLSKLGILSGYEDGTFRPNAQISRAEFAKIAVSFFALEDMEAENIFSDVVPGSWYESYVAAAAELGLIEGYEGGVFRPQASITRAETAAIVNRTLGRAPDAGHLLPEAEMNVWTDNADTGAWYYAHIQEATNSHTYRWLGDIEQWLQKLPEPDWDKLR